MRKVWVLFSVANDYNQPPKAFEDLFFQKPTAEQIGGSINLQSTSKTVLKIVNGERVKTDGTEYWLEEFTSNEVGLPNLNRPTDDLIIKFATVFSEIDGKVNEKTVSDMLAMTNFLLDRLQEHNDVLKKSSKELEMEKQSDLRYARLIGYLPDNADQSDVDYIETVVKNCNHIEWANKHNRMYYIYLTKDQYNTQMMMPDRTWCCPQTGLGDEFDDQYFEEQHG